MSFAHAASPPRSAARQPGRVRQRNQTALIAAAIEVFATKGLNGATTAEIAERAGLPKANLHYYFGTKQKLYDSVITHIISAWDKSLDRFQVDADPATTITAYVADKLAFSRDYPAASRLFALEVIGGARHVAGFIASHTAKLLHDKAKVLAAWAAQGKIDRVDADAFFFLLWSATQTYADFAAQIAILKQRDALDDAVFDAAARTITQIVLKGVGARGY